MKRIVEVALTGAGKDGYRDALAMWQCSPAGATQGIVA
jgi:chemotaxis response regulator CheB